MSMDVIKNVMERAKLALEELTKIDIDGDGYIGKPPPQFDPEVQRMADKVWCAVAGWCGNTITACADDKTYVFQAKKCVQKWRVPYDAMYRITLAGVRGGLGCDSDGETSPGGAARVVQLAVEMKEGEELRILAGSGGEHKIPKTPNSKFIKKFGGSSAIAGPGYFVSGCGGGGGACFIAGPRYPIAVAGGGGGRDTASHGRTKYPNAPQLMISWRQASLPTGIGGKFAEYGQCDGAGGGSYVSAQCEEVRDTCRRGSEHDGVVVIRMDSFLTAEPCEKRKTEREHQKQRIQTQIEALQKMVADLEAKEKKGCHGSDIAEQA